MDLLALTLNSILERVLFKVYCWINMFFEPFIVAFPFYLNNGLSILRIGKTWIFVLLNAFTVHLFELENEATGLQVPRW